MTNTEFYQKASEYAQKAGCEACETFYADGESFEANASGGEIDRYSVSREAGISVRVSFGGKQGYAYTEKIGEPEKLVDRAIDNAKCIETGDPHPMQKHCEYKNIPRAKSALAAMSEQERISLVKRLEQAVMAEDARVKRVVYCSALYESGRIAMQNTRDLDAGRAYDLSLLFVIPSVQDGDEVQTGFAFRMGADAADAEGCAKEAVRSALEKLGGKPVGSGTYRVLFKPDAFCGLLTAFSPMFSADEAQKGRSLLAGKEGQSVASEIVTLTDDPFDPVAPRAFDGEGTPCIQKSVVENGVLKTLLHNLKTAKKAGVESTGNASRRSAASTVGVAPGIFRIEPGERPFEEMVKLLGGGLIVTELEGLHAGVDTVSGDFSLKAAGFLVENGAIVRPVSGVTAAGNFIEMMKRVSALGSDMKYAFPQAGYYASPSVLVDGLTIAGN